MALVHGGDITGYEEKYGKKPLDFSASLNPAGMPAGVAQAARAAVDAAQPYPDPLSRRLTRALAGRLGIEAAHLFCTAGAADAIFRIVYAMRPKRALLPVPGFAEYELALRAAGCTVDYHYLPEDKDFAPNEGLLKALRPGVDICFVCNPGNPTGQLMEKELLLALLARCEETGTLLVLDECFGSFVRAEAWFSLMPWVEKSPHLVILGSFTKLYAMAGIRLGWAVCGNPALVPALRAAGQPWAVSGIAQAAGLAALNETAYAEKSLAAIHQSKAVLRAGLESRGARVMGSAANYLFFYTGIPAFGQRLADKGILVRSCANFEGLRDGYYRVAVRTAEENAQLLQAVDSLL